MAKTNSLAVRHQLAVKTEAQWKSADPVLLLGEVAISSDKNNQFKVGTGSAKWSALSYSQMGPTGATGATGVSLRVKGAWAASTAYVNNSSYIDVVTYGGSTYACKTSHMSASAWASANWTLLAQKGDTGAKGDKGDKGATGDKGISMRLKGAWAASTAYVNDSSYVDVVTYGGSTYACTTSHTSSTSWDSSKWTLLAQKGNTGDKGATGVSMRLKGAWTASTAYVNNTSYIDLVVYSGSLYACKTSHTSGTAWSSTNWTQVASKGDTGATGAKGISWRTKGAWAASTAYVNDTSYTDIITYNGSAYACKTSHTSGTSWDSSKWTLIVQKGDTGATGATGAKGVSVRLKGAWVASTAYVNDSFYIDAVTHDGNLYLCTTSHTSPTAWSASNWTIAASKGNTGATGVSMRLKGAWTASTAYVNNTSYIDFVTNGGNLYACKTSHTSGTSWSSTNWTLVANKGDTGAKGDKGDTGATGAKGVSMRLKGAWVASTAYVNDSNYIDIVTYNGNTYACKTSHTSASAWADTNWTMIAQKGNTGATGAKGVSIRLNGAWAASTAYVNDSSYIDAVTYGGSLYLCKTSHISGTSWSSTNWTLAASKGDTGAKGDKGDTGATGATGVSMRAKGAWAASTAYVNNSSYIDIVTYNGSAYACKTSHTSGTSWSSTNWTLLVSKGDTGAKGDKGDTGATGAKGVSVRLKGAWAASTAYVNDSSYIDAVTYGGSLYLCKTSHTSSTAWSSTNWTLAASKGDTGAKGDKGDTGATGAKGVSMRLKGAWAASTAYVNDSSYIDMVTYNGSTYACKTSHTSGTSWSDTNWTQVAAKGNTGNTGATGAKGVSIRLKGAWTASTAYVNDSSYIDAVTYGGSLYLCKTSHTSGTSWSSSNWTLSASKGDTGAKGDKGDTGDKGSTGDKGATGVGMRLMGAWAASTAYVNNSSYIDIVTYDGSTYGCKTSHTSGTAWDATNWTLLASKGDTGAKGATGDKGATGATGPGYNSVNGTLSVAADAWSGSGPYTAAVSVSGITATTMTIIACNNTSNDKTIAKNYSYISDCVSGAGTLTFTATMKPSAAVPIKYFGFNQS